MSHRERRPRRTEDSVPATAEVARPLAPSASPHCSRSRPAQAIRPSPAHCTASTRSRARRARNSPRPPRTSSTRAGFRMSVLPLDAVLVQEDEQWYVWSQNKREWQGTDAPDVTTAAVENEGEGEGEAETPPPKKEPAPPRRYPLPRRTRRFRSSRATAGCRWAARNHRVGCPGGALPDAFVEKMFGYLDTSSLLALRVASPWLLEHGSDALREHLHRRTKEHPKGRVGGTLSSMSSLGAKPLVEQYRDAVKARPTEKLVVAADKVNANTINTLTSGFRGAVTVHYNERTDRGRPDPRFNQVQGPYDQGTHGGVINSKMHNKLVVGEGAKGTKAEGAAKGDFLLSGWPNLTASAMGANIESAVLSGHREALHGLHRAGEDPHDRRPEVQPGARELQPARRGRDPGGPGPVRRHQQDAQRRAPGRRPDHHADVPRRQWREARHRWHAVRSGRDPKTTVEVVVDDKEAARTPYVRQALRRLSASGVKVGGEVGKEKERPRRTRESARTTMTR